jgi:hypothetical protein
MWMLRVEAERLGLPRRTALEIGNTPDRRSHPPDDVLLLLPES